MSPYLFPKKFGLAVAAVCDARGIVTRVGRDRALRLKRAHGMMPDPSNVDTSKNKSGARYNQFG